MPRSRMEPGLEFLLEARVRVEPALEFGETPRGRRRIVPIAGGTFEGPKLRGVVLPGGADWQIVRQDVRNRQPEIRLAQPPRFRRSR